MRYGFGMLFMVFVMILSCSSYNRGKMQDIIENYTAKQDYLKLVEQLLISLQNSQFYFCGIEEATPTKSTEADIP